MCALGRPQRDQIASLDEILLVKGIFRLVKGRLRSALACIPSSTENVILAF
jgi:hypothetical protein